MPRARSAKPSTKVTKSVSKSEQQESWESPSVSYQTPSSQDRWTAPVAQSSLSFQSLMDNVYNNFIVYVLVILAFFVGFFVGSLWTEWRLLKSGGGRPTAAPAAPTAAAPADAPSGPTKETLAKMPALSDQDMADGDINSASVVLVEYSDFECPFCARFHPTMKQVKEQYGDDVVWVYRHYPLPFHPNAQKAAEGSECVAKIGGQDAFWVYSDALVEVTASAGKLSPEAIASAAEKSGVDAAAFQTCLDSGEMAQKIKDQMAGGSAAGINGTPGTVIVVDGVPQELIPGALPFEQVKPMIDQYL